MKRWIHAQTKSKPYKLSANKLRKATVYKDTVTLVPYPIDADKVEELVYDFKNGRLNTPRINWYGTGLSEGVWAANNGISCSDLQVLKVNYIIDTQGHVDLASISDDETLDSFEFEPLSDAIRKAIRMIQADLTANDGPSVVRANIYLTIYGYGDYSLTFGADISPIEMWGEVKKPLVKEFTFLECKDEPFSSISINSVLTNNTNFKRRFMPGLIKLLSKPLSRLH